MSTNGDVIQAKPSKAFFIDMLTRDITLDECILDLTDNSIHNLIRETKIDVMDILLGKSMKRSMGEAKIQVTFSQDEFSIKDTCGGIPIDDARDQVFLLGNPKPEKPNAGLGVYGIGMKRAFFKIGRDIVMESRTSNEEFGVNIDVDEWQRREDDWTLRFAHQAKRKNPGRSGTQITIRKINPAVSQHFRLVSFQNEVIRKIGSTYSLFLRAGLSIEINSNKVRESLTKFLSSRDLKPVRHYFQVGDVEILILAGITPRDDKDPRGWYIFCNGRMIIEADKTSLTGWGDNKFPQFHSKYNHFLGIVYFKSKNLGALPWTTTKDGVDRESSVYQRALGEMRVVAKPITEFLNRMYDPEIPITGRGQFALLEKAESVATETLAARQDSTFVARVSPVKRDDRVTISYKRPFKDVQKVKKALGNQWASNREVGEKTFDYFVRKESL